MLLLACLAGGLGAVARAGVDELAALRFPAWSGTLAINVAGSFILGIASVTLPAEWVMVIGTGTNR